MTGCLGRGRRWLLSALCGLSFWLTAGPAAAQDLLLFGAAPCGPSGPPGTQNILAGTVIELSREEGAFVEVNVEVDGVVLTARLTRRVATVLRLAPGQPVFVLVKTIALDRVARLGAEPD